MCSVLVASGVVPGEPIVVVANRDEQLDRPARAPFRWPQGFVAPRDEQAGGTWLGIAKAGFFVGITNRFLGPRDTTRASRGELVVQALAQGSVREVHEAMRRIDARRYNGFHLVYADATDVLVTVGDGETLAQLELGRGVHLVTERSFDGAKHLDTKRRARALAAWARGGERTKLLAEHDAEDILGSTCIHLPELRYGTRSAMVWNGTEIRWAEGPPCTTPFVIIEER